jgi:hypothetical protein
MSRKYTNDQFIQAIKSSTSYRQVLKKLGLAEAGGNYESIKRLVKSLNLDITHMTGKSSNKGIKFGCKNPIEHYLTEDSHYQSFKLKKRLLSENIKPHQCEKCGITHWNGEPTPLELDHINGISTDNRIENLRMLCPNCHAQTETYRGKNIGRLKN